MTLPGVTQTIRDGGLGQISLPGALHCKAGLCTGGTANVVAQYGDPQALVDALGRGPLVEAALYFMEITGLPVAVCKIAQAAAGTIGSFTKVGTGPDVSDNSSAPEDTFALKIEILVGGAVGTATFRYSLDGGDTWSPAITTAATYNIANTGISVTFAAGTYIVGDTYSADTVAPSFDTTGLNAALDAIAAYTAADFRLVHVVGYGADGAATATVAAAVDTKMTASAAAFHYTYTVLEAAEDDDADLLAAFASFASTRVGVAAGFIEAASAGTTFKGAIFKRPAAWPIVARIMSVAISRDPGAVRDGPVAGVVSSYRDEEKTPGLDAGRFMTLRTFRGQPGIFVTRGRLMASAGSDFTDCTNRQVLDVASAIAYAALFLFVNSDLRVDVDGKILDVEARQIEGEVLAKLRAALTQPGDASSVSFVIDRDQNIFSTGTLKAKTRVVPKGYARFIENEIAFRNPALDAIVATT